MAEGTKKRLSSSFRLSRTGSTNDLLENESNEEYQKRINEALSRLNEGSKYHSPAQSEDVSEFKTRISIRNSTLARRKKKGDEISLELQSRSDKIAALVESERKYLGDLFTLQSDWFSVIKEKRLLRPIQIATIFSNLEYVQSLSEELSFTLDVMRNDHPEAQMIGEEFIRLGGYFGLYTQYSANFPKAISMLHQCRKSNKRFDKFIEMKQAEDNAQALEYYLELPTARVTEYPPLLKEILACTSKEHKDYHMVYQALFMLDDLVSNVENERKILENNSKILAIEASIEGHKKLTVSGRWFLLEGEVQWSENNVPKGVRRLFLFSDALLMVKRVGRTRGKLSKKPYSIKEILALSSLFLLAVSDSQAKIQKIQLLLPNEKEVTVVFPSLELKQQFYSKLSELIRTKSVEEDAHGNEEESKATCEGEEGKLNTQEGNAVSLSGTKQGNTCAGISKSKWVPPPPPRDLSMGKLDPTLKRTRLSQRDFSAVPLQEVLKGTDFGTRIKVHTVSLDRTIEHTILRREMTIDKLFEKQEKLPAASAC